MQRYLLYTLLFCILLSFVQSIKKNEKAKKNVVDMTDADIEKIYEEWEVRLFLARYLNYFKLKFVAI
jgi:hypothetical protein